MTGTLAAAERRRTFAITSHPDADKTTLTGKLVLSPGASDEAEAVKARAGRQWDVTYDWLDMQFVSPRRLEPVLRDHPDLGLETILRT